MNKILVQGIVLFVLGGYSVFSAAACRWVGTPFEETVGVELDDLRVPASLPVGSVLMRKTYNLDNARTAAFCDPASSLTMGWAGFLMTPISFQNEILFSVSREGIALRITTSPQFPGNYFPRARTMETFGASSFAYNQWGPSITFELVKTKPVVTPGFMVALGSVSPYIVFPGEARVVGGPAYNFFGKGNVVPGTCAVTSKEVGIALGTAEKRAFPAGGGPVPGARDVGASIDLVCDAGTKAKVTLDGATAPNMPTILSTTSTGVGVELLLQGNPVTYGRQIDLGTIGSDGPFSIPLIARYYGTGGPVTGGALRANATFTFDFL